MVELASPVNLPEAHKYPTTELYDRIAGCHVLIGEPLYREILGRILLQKRC
jgi:hypothetical protein